MIRHTVVFRLRHPAGSGDEADFLRTPRAADADPRRRALRGAASDGSQSATALALDGVRGRRRLRRLQRAPDHTASCRAAGSRGRGILELDFELYAADARAGGAEPASSTHRQHAARAARPLAAELACRCWRKCEHLNPGGSVKDRIALAIVARRRARGVLRPGDTIVEATAGNTGVGLALVAGVRGYRLVCVMPEKMSPDKRTALAALGAQRRDHANAPPATRATSSSVARRLAAEHGWFLADQFCNPANPRCTSETTGPRSSPRRWPHRRVRRRRRHRRDHHRRRAVPAARLPGARVVLADPLGSRPRRLGRDGQRRPRHRLPDRGHRRGRAAGGDGPVVIDAAERISDAELRDAAACCARRACSSAARPEPPSRRRCASRAPAGWTGPLSRSSRTAGIATSRPPGCARCSSRLRHPRKRGCDCAEARMAARADGR